MSDPRIDAFWKATTIDQGHSITHGNLVLSRKAISEGISLSVLKLDTSIFVSVSDPTWDQFLDFLQGRSPTLLEIEQFARDNGREWNPPDQLYYLHNPRPQGRPSNDDQVEVRQLSSADLTAFEEMTSECSEEDLDAG